MINIYKLIRDNVRNLTPYSCARDEYSGEAMVFLDANENPFNQPYNRYPDPLQRNLKAKIAKIKTVNPENIFLGNGSDEPIDLMIRAFCEPRVDNIVMPNPTYGMYRVAADVNAVEVRQIELDDNFDIQSDKILEACDKHTKLIFLCSPNNPTGNSLNPKEIINIIENLPGIVILDEAYIDFSAQKSFVEKLPDYPNLVILQTFSKAYGMAGIRLGMAFASKEIISVLNKIKYPYNINALTQEHALKALEKNHNVGKWVKELLAERDKLITDLATVECIKKVYPSDANFILVRTDDANDIYNYLVNKGIIIRNRNNVALCSGCLRITVGTAQENEVLIDALKNCSK